MQNNISVSHGVSNSLDKKHELRVILSPCKKVSKCLQHLEKQIGKKHCSNQQKARKCREHVLIGDIKNRDWYNVVNVARLVTKLTSTVQNIEELEDR